jgi:hypothetical protein
MQALITTAHTFAAVALVHSIKTRREREEQFVTLMLVVVIALAGLAQMFLGISSAE